MLPQRWCLGNDVILIGVSVAGNVMIMLSYIAIAIRFWVLVRRRVIGMIVGRSLFFLFSLFIMLSGLTHLMRVVVIWYPLYELQFSVDGLTGLVAMVAALLFVPRSIWLIGHAGGVDVRFKMHEYVQSENIDKLRQILRDKGVA